MNRGFTKFILSACGFGLIPFARGTWGSAVGLLGVWLLHPWPIGEYLVFFLLWITTVSLLNQYLPQTLDRDPQWVVMDEVLGIFVTFFALPLSWKTAAAGFILFRFFDIMKPLGIRRIERMYGAWGIILDDVAAGLLAHAVLALLLVFWRP